MNVLRSTFLFIFALTLVSCADQEPKKFDPPAADTDSEEAAMEEGRPVTAEKLNLNTATKEEFMTVPDVGERMAHEFDEYRPYVSISQFRREMAKYVDDAQIAAYEDHVFVPIDMNESDAETVAQILGLDLEGAESLVEGRPYASQDAFIAAVTEVAGGVASQFATLYLSE